MTCPVARPRVLAAATATRLAIDGQSAAMAAMAAGAAASSRDLGLLTRAAALSDQKRWTGRPALIAELVTDRARP